MFYNIVLVSAVQQSESAVCICISPPSKTSPDNPTPLDHHRALSWALFTIIAGSPLAICFIHSSVYIREDNGPHSSTFAWKIPWTEEPGRLQSMGSLELDTTERLHFHFSLSCIGEGNGNPFQCSCLENPRDGEAWWAAISGVAQSRTRLKRLSSSSSSSSVYMSILIS